MKGRLKKEIILFLILVFASLFLIFADERAWLNPIRGFFERPVIVLQDNFFSFKNSIDDSFKVFSSKRLLEQENMRLLGKLRQLAVDQGGYSACLEENEKMRRLLGAPLPSAWQFLPAKVIGQVGHLRLDKGKKAGVEAGMMVVLENNLVGRVVSVEEQSALVKLVIDSGVKIPVVIKKPGEGGILARGILSFQKEGLIVEDILQNEDVKIGDLVLTDGEGGWLPDLLIGQIDEVSGEGAAIYKQASVLPLVKNEELRTVFVVTDY